MNRILIVHRDRQALDGLEKLLLNRANHQITLAETTVQCTGVAGRRASFVKLTHLA